MFKTFLVKILPILVPILIFTIWYYHKLTKKQKPKLNEAPYKLMFVVFLLTFLSVIIGFRISSQKDVGGAYKPAFIENGKIIPGDFKDD